MLARACFLPLPLSRSLSRAQEQDGTRERGWRCPSETYIRDGFTRDRRLGVSAFRRKQDPVQLELELVLMKARLIVVPRRDGNLSYRGPVVPACTCAVVAHWRRSRRLDCFLGRGVSFSCGDAAARRILWHGETCQREGNSSLHLIDQAVRGRHRRR